jgi:hypothetical protein
MTRIILAFIACSIPALAAGPPPEFKVGVGTHFAFYRGAPRENMSLIRQAGVNALRDDLLWQRVETVKGQYKMPENYDAYVSAALAAGIEPLPILGGWSKFYDDGSDRAHSPEALEALARYCEFVVQHFKGRVKTYEIWNEWDAVSRQTEKAGTVEGYANVLKAVYRRMKAIDPGITVMGGAMTSHVLGNGWLEGFLRSGALENLDAISIHTYRNAGSPDYRERGAEGWALWMQRVDDLTRKYSAGKPIPIYVTEMGWTTELTRGTPPTLSAAYLARMYLLARTMAFLKGIWWYDFQDDGWGASEREHNFGLVHADLTPKPSYFAMAGVAELVRTAQYVGRVETGDPEIWILKFRRPDGKDAWAIWSAHEDDYCQVTLHTSRANPAPVSLCQIGATPVEREWGAWERPPRNREAPDQLSILVREMPWLVVGDLSAVKVAGVERREFPESTRPPKPGPRR